ncbi:MAG: pyridoxamine 5'-phosphate oxidase family protein [Anaerolineae bacterium]|nr:pyridoxamine 5'-phosphate oxidase family protein [Anaerolineae bacterium]
MTPNPHPSRPGMKNYGISTEPDGLMAWDWAVDQLTRSRNYWISTAGADGNPHAAPVWAIWMDGMLVFGTGEGTRKERNFRHNANVVVHLESGDDVVILEGRVEVMRDVSIVERFGKLYEAKYGLNPVDDSPEGSTFWGFRPRTGLTWLEHDFPKTATRWTFDDPA